MSTQDDSGIPFQINREQEHFRLLELPPSLLSLIASKDPPNLWLKSAESSSANVDSKQPGPSAVLCTDEHTYQLRQVQSSNSVFILQPSESRCGDDEISTHSLSAIAQCTATLELIPSDPTSSSAMVIQLLKKSLPPYKGIDTDVGSGTNTTFSTKYKDKKAISQDAPFSSKEFDKVWTQLCVFEVLGRAWLPTPSSLAMIWKSILSVATVRGVNLEKKFHFKSLAEMVGGDGYPWALFIAVMLRLASDTDYLKDNYATLSRDKTVQWVGIVCLERAGGSDTEGISQSDFLAQWYDLLPEGWRKHASMDLLKARYSHSNPSKEDTVFGGDVYDPTSLENLPPANTGRKLGKWHEKFKSGRK
ncbi:hypothetical protein IMSHALPRED_003798 [Imshaugia aleurites]|uniref:Sister chromatid cohesion protein Dcc1 n=1 Tax=Imshaugia aleurites TaxID=172621 RepID=A0A8H3F6M5_9LECA|nr:hypothetical protein IMSHALPRED_003798 [Imshaugia aleurites]